MESVGLSWQGRGTAVQREWFLLYYARGAYRPLSMLTLTLKLILVQSQHFRTEFTEYVSLLDLCRQISLVCTFATVTRDRTRFITVFLKLLVLCQPTRSASTVECSIGEEIGRPLS